MFAACEGAAGSAAACRRSYLIVCVNKESVRSDARLEKVLTKTNVSVGEYRGHVKTRTIGIKREVVFT